MNATVNLPVHGVGLGLRRSLLGALAQAPRPVADFLEVAPENWIGLGGRLARQFRAVAERYPLICHGLSLNLGGLAPLDTRLLNDLRAFLDANQVQVYSEHLSACGDHGQLYDLLPVPFTDANVRRIAERIAQVQDALGRPLIIENVSAYLTLPGEMSEPEFVAAVLDEADCNLLLDVNNVYVNSINHRYDPRTFIDGVDPQRVRYLHVAGHYVEAEGVRVDTHGADVCADVWDLLDHTYARIGVLPTLLERDFNLPPLSDLRAELQQIRDLQARHQAVKVPAGA